MTVQLWRIICVKLSKLFRFCVLLNLDWNIWDNDLFPLAAQDE